MQGGTGGGLGKFHILGKFIYFLFISCLYWLPRCLTMNAQKRFSEMPHTFQQMFGVVLRNKTSSELLTELFSLCSSQHNTSKVNESQQQTCAVARTCCMEGKRHLPIQ